MPAVRLSIVDAFREWRLMRRCYGTADPVVIENRYELCERIGGGGFGTVYRALDRDLRRHVAVKVLKLGDREEAKREGQALAAVDHPHVVKIHDHGTGTDYRYYVLQLLEGPTLREWCEGKTPIEIVSKYIEAARGLGAAHQAGLVHRDFKPSNVRVGSKGEAVVVDFGLARHLSSLEGDSEERTFVVGTIAYAPPERLIGQIGDERSDQFSFCVALWEALSGSNPFGSSKSAADRFAAMRSGPKGEIVGSKRVRRALLRGLSISPADRFPSMDHLIDVLERPKRRSRWADAVVGAIASLTAAVSLAWMMPPQISTDGFLGPQLVAVFATTAEVRAESGQAEEALQILESLQRQPIDEEAARFLTGAATATAIAFEGNGRRNDALYAWSLAVMLARTSSDPALVDAAQLGLSRCLATAPQRESM